MAELWASTWAIWRDMFLAEALVLYYGDLLRWFRRVEHKDNAVWIKHCMLMEVDGGDIGGKRGGMM